MLLEGGDLVVGELDVERGDGVGEAVRLVDPTMGALTTGLRSTHASPIWAIGTTRASATRCTASTI